MPSGRGGGLCRYRAPDGHTTLEGETFTLEIDGDHVSGTVRSSLWWSMADGLPYGVTRIHLQLGAGHLGRGETISSGPIWLARACVDYDS